MSAASAPAPRRAGAWPRGNLVLAALAVVQLAVLLLVVLTVARPPRTQAGPLLGAGVTPDAVVGITLTDADGNTLDLAKKGVDWVLPDAGDYPADATRVGDFLTAVTGLQRRGLVADTKDAYKRLKVADDAFERKVTLTLDGGASTTLLIGSEPSYGSTHLRVQGDQGVYLTHTLHASQARTDASAWIDPQVVDLNKADVTEVTLHNAQGTFHFTRSGDGWTLDGLRSGKTLDPHQVSLLLDRVTQLRIHAPLGKTAKPAYGLDAPTATLTLVTQPRPAAAPDSSGASGGASGASTGSGTPTAAGGTAAGDTAAGGTASGAPVAAGAGSNPAPSTTAPTTTAPSTPAPSTPAPTTTTITVGAKLDDGNYAVTTSTTPYLLSVSSYALDEAPAKAQADFLVKPKTTAGN